MNTIRLTSNNNSITIISNTFLDKYMPSANGEFVKVYLMLMRSLSGNLPVSVCGIADTLNHTEKDVVRALKYWEQTGLLTLKYSPSNEITHIHMLTLQEDSSISADTISNSFTPDVNNISDTPEDSIFVPEHDASPDSPDTNKSIVSKAITTHLIADATDGVPEKITYSKNELSNFVEQDDISELIFVAQKYIGKTLSITDTNTLLYIYDKLGFTVELMEYLIEYCVSVGHKNLRYMEKVAISWSQENIITVEQAKESTSLYSKKCYPVLKAFGLNGRNPGASEKAFIVKWTNSYGFSMDIILNACDRTIQTIHQPSFEYADTILTNWSKQGVKHLDDIKKLDAKYEASQKQMQASQNAQKTNKIASASKNTFNDFSQRTYDYDALEKRILANR